MMLKSELSKTTDIFHERPLLLSGVLSLPIYGRNNFHIKIVSY